jgi:hypothetical protein
VKALDGPQIFARYAFMPNSLSYCGGEDHRALFDYCLEGKTDAGLTGLLVKFTGALPYLRLIAHCNLISDPFDRRVVEAYWLGNDLLEGVEAHTMYDSVRERFEKRLKPEHLNLILGKAPVGARPHHSFHVIEVCPRLGWPHALSFMDNCRVSWGRVTEVNGSILNVDVRPLKIEGHSLALSEVENRVIKRQLEGRGFVEDAQPGDWISIHWNWACQTLTDAQVQNLERWTEYHLKLANLTL